MVLSANIYVRMYICSLPIPGKVENKRKYGSPSEVVKESKRTPFRVISLQENKENKYVTNQRNAVQKDVISFLKPLSNSRRNSVNSIILLYLLFFYIIICFVIYCLIHLIHL